MAKPKPKDCAYCHGHGLQAYWWALGIRRVVPSGPHGKLPDEWKNTKRVPCDRCNRM